MATRLTDSEIHGLQSFSVEDTNNIGTRWKRWLRSFELYAGGKGVSQPEQKKALLLHTAGSRVQDIFFTLTLEQGEEVDYYSRWFEIEVTKVTTSEKITRILSKMFVTHGLPVSIQTDNGTQFISEHFRSFMQLHGIIHRHTTPLWPQANGEVERQNRSIMKRVRIAHAQGRDWKSDLDDYLIMYRSTAHTVTGVSPSKLLFGREMRTKLPNLWEFSIDDVEVRDRDRERKEKSKVYADQRRNAQESDLKEGDRVLVRQEKENKLSTPFNPNPMTVVERNGNAVLIESDQGAHYKRNITHVKKFNENHVQKECSQSEIKENNFAENEITDKFDMLELDVPDNNVPENVCVDASQNEIIESRPVRTRKMPARFNDFIVG
ncbi:hypothetical protein FSP39_012381 [Pinctada imbricata]|uniref:Integrase catalytic domain-containing protein n=1 Tax=Pinctada imbricata TaxID=66713 RepID=A0AA88XFG4_PINIB|nr:hypothetical protein FSP39_012381 [Pinctada imbricata]